MARLRKSAEVQHGVKGMGRMFRRGLYGCKEWILELDSGGEHRSVMSKLFRLAVVLAPLWIVLSAFTGGPERGGKSVSAFQSLLMAFLTGLVMLGLFSARERKLGREEPWLDLTPIDTNGDDGGPKAEAESSTEEPLGDFENPQVRELSEDGGLVTRSDIPDEEDHSSHAAEATVTEAVIQAIPRSGSDEVFDQLSDQVTTSFDAETWVVDEAETEVINHHFPDSLEEEAPTVVLGGGHRAAKVVGDVPEIQKESQIIDPFPVVSEIPRRGPAVSLEKVTESESDHPKDQRASPVTSMVTKGVQEPLFLQVKEGDHPVIPVVTLPVAPQMGLYKTTVAPASEDWWVDLPRTPQLMATKPVQEATKDVEAVVETVAMEPQEGPLQEYPPEIVTYFAVRSMPDVTENVKDRARQDATAWVRAEIQARRLSQRSAATLLGVSKTTIANWLNDDPWSAVEGEVE
jgi:hypothetical protein